MRFLLKTRRSELAFSASYKSFLLNLHFRHICCSSDLSCPSSLHPRGSCSLLCVLLPFPPLASDGCLTRLALEENPRPLLHLMRQLRCMQVPPT
jgi:hypothetical protein